MLKIKFTRIGKKHEPHYRIIVIPARTKREGRAVEQIGYYNPRTKELKLDKERAKHWLSVGAQPTNTVHDLFAKQKLLEPRKRIHGEPRKPKKEAGKKEAGEKAKQKEAPEKKKEVKKEKEKSPKKEEKQEDKKDKDKKEEKKDKKETKK